MSNGLLMKDYKPISRLSVPRHKVSKPKFPVFDVHTHFGPMVLGEDYAAKYDTGQVVGALKEAGVFGVISLELLWDEALDIYLAKIGKYGDFVKTYASVDIGRMEDADFVSYVDKTLSRQKDKGICGIKLWKNLGLGLRDSTGSYIAPDDDRLRPIFDSAAKYDLPILIHIADPKAFFTAVDGKNEYYESLSYVPEWSFFGDDFFSFEQLMEMQSNILSRNPDTTFIIAHVGSCAEDLAFVGSQLDEFPNMYIDTAARVSELGRQPYTAREFFLRYQDRILFGTDYYCKNANDTYPHEYRFYETFDEYFRNETEDGEYGWCKWNIYGLGLPDDVLKKFYADNARRLLHI